MPDSPERLVWRENEAQLYQAASIADEYARLRSLPADSETP